METQINTITRLVDEILNFSRMQEGKLEYAPDRIDLDKLLREVIDTIHSMQTTHTVVIYPPSSPSLIIGDRDQLERVFLNVLSNAIKYAPCSPLIEVWLTHKAETVTISVRDQGIGIPQEVQGKIFERFYRAVPLQQRAFPGFGMGLYIVSEIVKYHRGTIRVESEQGKGSTFHLTFPLASQESFPAIERRKSNGQEPADRPSTHFEQIYIDR
ncbi:sensor histidine kinase [Dictyobacter kobayashii]|uniref:histidine kinase n=1 Tax=Dictyobacter kobayashii TaxID=2014872 RepID=A0A402AKR7_9CHLR|nr:HAMP domain-containing sensor histidine kinase [Dictyobacter kobayashii]GCE19711.1 hypothetical protein KDK_35110 [Dictyobacter kobayashii]